jgi:ATP-dependent protease ClpP protease subunit
MKQRIQVFNFNIQNAANDAVDIFIDGDIVDADTQAMYKYWLGDDTSVSYKSFRDQVLSSTANNFNIYINSGGGLVTDAMAIHDLLIDLQNKGKVVNTVGRGIIASAATYILMAGRNASMSANSWLMVHNVSGIAYGDVNQVEAYARTMRKFNDASTQFYSDATGLSKTVIANMMDAETWMTAQEAKDKGFIKQVSADATFTQYIPKEQWLNQYQYQNMAVLNSYNNNVQQPATGNINLTEYFNDMKKFLQSTAEGIMNSIKGIKAPENGDHQTLMNSIAEAMQPLTQVGEQMDTEIGAAITNAVEHAQKDPESPLAKLISNAVATAVTNQITTPIPDLVNAAVTEATKGFVTEEDMEKEIKNMKGTASNSKAEGDTMQPIGKRVNY